MFKEYKLIDDADENVQFGEGTNFVGNKAVVKVAPGGVFRCGKNCKFHHSEIRVERGATVILGDDCTVRGEIVAHHKGSTIRIGDRLVINTTIRMRCGEGATIEIGNDCLFANPVIYSSDYHGIYDVTTKRRVNHARDIKIHDRVWLAYNAVVLKGAEIGPDTVVGAGAVVSGRMPGGSIVAGSPAKVIRQGIRWSRDPHEEMPQHLWSIETPPEPEAERIHVVDDGKRLDFQQWLVTSRQAVWSLLFPVVDFAVDFSGLLLQ